MTTPVICRPPSFPIRRILACPTCKQRRRMAGRDFGPYYGPTVTCLGCGDSWSSGEMLERPFKRGWRKESIATAKRAWEEAGRYTRAEYEAWLAAELAAVTADYGTTAEDGRPVDDLPLPDNAA
jgi:hypothetical protein